MILQPLAENALEYGLKDVEESGHIHVRFAKDENEKNKLLVIIEDSGRTADDGALAKMNENITRRDEGAEVSSTMNITRRLRLFYGDGYGLCFKRGAYGGVKAVVTLDGERRMDDEYHKDNGG